MTNWESRAENEIYKTYGDLVSIEQKGKSLLKFGNNSTVGTSEATIWDSLGATLLNETYATDNTIDYVVTDDADFTGQVTIEGHWRDGVNLIFRIQTVTLTGQTPKQLTYPLVRATRIYNSGDSTLATSKIVYVYDSTANVGGVSAGVPQTVASIHVTFHEANNQSEKASTSISAVDYWLISNFRATIRRNQSANAIIKLEIRNWQKSYFRVIYEDYLASDSAPINVLYRPLLIIPKNYDVRVVATASTGNTQVSASINGFLAKKVG